MTTLTIEHWSRATHQLRIGFRLDDLAFTTSLWWSDVDLPALEARFGRALLEKVYFHIAAFEANKLASLRPDTFELGPFAHLWTPAFETLWRTVFRRVWAQWRYEHDLPGYDGPVIRHGGAGPEVPALRRPPPAGGAPETLAFCGGGKDSLVALGLLARGGLPYASYGYSHSVYGAPAPQHALLDRLLDHAAPVRRHRHWVFDDFLDAPVAALEPARGVRSLTAAETPASLFGAIPLVLAQDYRLLALAHERSANVGNLIWGETGEEVNHQWGKSYEAERLLADYVRAELCDVDYVSVLQPVYDPVIFQLLARDLGAVPATHSCNLRKPWCRRCPKCAYVWLGYLAYLPREVVDGIFGENLFDVPDNLLFFRQMLGLEAHTPFECIGRIEDVRLAFELCRRKGLGGAAMDLYAALPPPDLAALAERCLEVAEVPTLPPRLAAAILPQLREAAAAARAALLDGPAPATGATASGKRA
jgi:UDP-N-acetyl-alpha-D-muramoyl-L-alanyl-L-glutamate epimerase